MAEPYFSLSDEDRAEVLELGRERTGRPAHLLVELELESKRLVFTGVQHVKDRADQQRMRGLLPVVASLQRALGINKDVGDVLDIADLVFAPPYLEKRVVGCRPHIGRIELEAM